MPFQVVCPQCLATSLVADEHAGAKGRCKSCRGKVRVPSHETTSCALCGVGLSDTPVITDEAGKSYCKVCWLDEIEPQRTANESANIVGCALCGNLFPSDQVKAIDNVFVCVPCADASERRLSRTAQPSPLTPEKAVDDLNPPVIAAAATAASAPSDMPSLLDRSPVLKLARGLLRI